MNAQVAAPATQAPSPQPATRPKMLVLAAVIGVLVLAGAIYVFVPSYFEEETDDAYVEAHIQSVIPKVPAYAAHLYIDDNSRVHAGDLLLQLDPRDYETQVAVSQADVAAAEGRLKEARDEGEVATTAVHQRQADLEVAQAHESLADITLKRLRSVTDVRAVSTQRVDDATAQRQATQAEVLADQVAIQAAQAQLVLARSHIVTAQATVLQAKAHLAQAQLNLSYTRIYADRDATVANKLVEPGNFVQPGQLLFVLVPDAPYVVANYRETQVTRMRPGQKVLVRVDAFPERYLHGHVDSLQPGTGSRFALLPPQNATGNFIKVVQRVPVKIVFDEQPEILRRISPGMSVETEVFFGQHPHWLGLFE